MKKYKLPGIIVAIIFIIFVATGCWNSKELNEWAFVMGWGMDKSEKPGEVHLTAQVIRIQQIQATTNGGGMDGEESFWNIKYSAPTLSDALRKMTSTANRSLYNAHSQVYIVGEDLAKEGISKYMDVWFRDNRTYRNGWFLVAKGRAEEALEVKPKIEQMPARYIAQLIEERASSSLITGVNLQELMTRMVSETTAPVASVIEVVEEGEEKSIDLSGTAVFKGDKLAGYLDPTETRGLLWVLGEVKHGIVTVDCADSEGKIGLEIISAKSTIVPKIENDQIQITIKITTSGNISEIMCSEDFLFPSMSSTVKSSIEKGEADVIRSEILATLVKAQEWGTDIFEFGNAVHRVSIPVEITPPVR